MSYHKGGSRSLRVETKEKSDFRKRDVKLQRKETEVKRVAFANEKSEEKEDSILRRSEDGDENVSPGGIRGNSSAGSRKTRGLGKKTIEKHRSMEQEPELAVTKKKSASTRKITCKCSKSGCLKMYCECFTIGRYCDEACACKNCCNQEGNEEKIRSARKNIRSRNPLAFKPKV